MYFVLEENLQVQLSYANIEMETEININLIIEKKKFIKWNYYYNATKIEMNISI